MENFQTTPNTTNIKEAAICMLKTPMLMEKEYGADYLTQILQGNTRFGLRKDFHKNIETFGSLEGLYSDKLTNIIYYLLDQGYLEIKRVDFGTLTVSAKGKTFLDAPADLFMPTEKIETTSMDNLMKDAMKYLRTSLSEKNNVKIWQVFSNYTIRCIIDKKPVTVTEVESIPGMNAAKTASYGEAIITQVRRVHETPGEVIREITLHKAKSNGHQLVKRHFTEGKSIEEIGIACNLVPRTIRRYLVTLHKANEIDLKPWIEKTIDTQDLQKGAAYFREDNRRRLKVANEALGLDYETLRMCRLYVRKSA